MHDPYPTVTLKVLEDDFEGAYDEILRIITEWQVANPSADPDDPGVEPGEILRHLEQLSTIHRVNDNAFAPGNLTVMWENLYFRLLESAEVKEWFDKPTWAERMAAEERAEERRKVAQRSRQKAKSKAGLDPKFTARMTRKERIG